MCAHVHVFFIVCWQTFGGISRSRGLNCTKPHIHTHTNKEQSSILQAQWCCILFALQLTPSSCKPQQDSCDIFFSLWFLCFHLISPLMSTIEHPARVLVTSNGFHMITGLAEKKSPVPPSSWQPLAYTRGGGHEWSAGWGRWGGASLCLSVSCYWCVVRPAISPESATDVSALTSVSLPFSVSPTSLLSWGPANVGAFWGEVAHKRMIRQSFQTRVARRCPRSLLNKMGVRRAGCCTCWAS